MIQVRSLNVDKEGKIYCFIQEDGKACFYFEEEIDKVLYPYSVSPNVTKEGLEQKVEYFLNKKGVTIKNIPSIKILFPPIAYIYSKMILSEFPEKEFVLNENTLTKACKETGWSKMNFLLQLTTDIKKYHLEEDFKLDNSRLHFITKMTPKNDCYREIRDVLAIKDMSRPAYYAIVNPSLLQRFTIDVEKENKGFFSSLLGFFFK